MKRIRKWSLLLLLCLSGTVYGQDEIITVNPVDHGGPLVNPNMGWEIYFYSNILDNYGSRLEAEDTVDDFPGVSTVFLRLPWSFLEPEKNNFNWEIIDTPAQRWIEKGKKVAFCISATENWTRQGTPQWVFNDGAKYYTVDNYLEADYNDPVYLRSVDHFVKKMAERYDGNPHVAFVAIGHFGMWGEGHTVLTTPKHHHEWGFQTQKKFIDIYTRHFKKTQICMSDDFAGHDKPGWHFKITDYAFQKGVTLWDCSILVQPKPRHWYHSEMAQQFWPKMPVILEHEHYQGALGRGSWDKELLLQAVEDYHASYMSIHGWPREELNGNRDIIERINRRLGYRLQLSQASWPRTIKKDVAFNISAEWKNAGVAPCYGGGYPCFTIKNNKGGIVSVLVDTDFNVKDLLPAAPGEAVAAIRSCQFTVARVFKNSFGTFSRACQQGEYQLYFSIGEVDGTPIYELPYPHCDGHKRYLLGDITLL